MWRVLVVEDSPTVREALISTLHTRPHFRVVASSASGMQATRLAAALRPDLITLDVVLPDIDGVSVIRNIMSHTPSRILVVSGRTRTRDAPIAIDALRAGAADVVAKPVIVGDRSTLDDFLNAAEALCKKPVPMLVGQSVASGAPLGAPAKPAFITPAAQPQAAPREPRSAIEPEPAPEGFVDLPSLPPRVIAIGASTGGPAALERMFKQWPSQFALPVLVAQHMTTGFNDDLVGWLGSLRTIKVKIAESGEVLSPGVAYFPPDRHHLTVSELGNIALVHAEEGETMVPSINHLFTSIANAYGASAIGVLLTGMGEDGAQGLRLMRKAGARTVVQDRGSSLIFGMPQAAIKIDAARLILPLDEIGVYLLQRATARGKVDVEG